MGKLGESPCSFLVSCAAQYRVAGSRRAPFIVPFTFPTRPWPSWPPLVAGRLGGGRCFSILGSTVGGFGAPSSRWTASSLADHTSTRCSPAWRGRAIAAAAAPMLDSRTDVVVMPWGCSRLRPSLHGGTVHLEVAGVARNFELVHTPRSRNGFVSIAWLHRHFPRPAPFGVIDGDLGELGTEELMWSALVSTSSSSATGPTPAPKSFGSSHLRARLRSGCGSSVSLDESRRRRVPQDRARRRRSVQHQAVREDRTSSAEPRPRAARRRPAPEGGSKATAWRDAWRDAPFTTSTPRSGSACACRRSELIELIAATMEILHRPDKRRPSNAKATSLQRRRTGRHQRHPGHPAPGLQASKPIWMYSSASCGYS